MPPKPPRVPSPALPVRAAAPHVHRATASPDRAEHLAPPAQAKAAGSLRTPATHVRAALSAVQAKLPPFHAPSSIQRAEEAPRRSTRARAEAPVTANRDTLRAGYNAFNAAEASDTKSGTTTTTAVLRIGEIPYTGASGNGHAEMDALNDILIGNGDDLSAVRAHAAKTVECTAKPCCYRCSVVLGLLGFAPYTAATRKTRSGMGSTQWVLPEPLRSALARVYGDIQTLLSGFSNVNEL